MLLLKGEGEVGRAQDDERSDGSSVISKNVMTRTIHDTLYLLYSGREGSRYPVSATLLY